MSVNWATGREQRGLQLNPRQIPTSLRAYYPRQVHRLIEQDIAPRGQLQLTAAAEGKARLPVTAHGQADPVSYTHLDVYKRQAVAQRATKGEYAIYYSTDIGRTVGALIEAIAAAGDTLIDLRVERPSLEDRFLELTTEKQP